jgi:hypothetical protein
MPFSGKICFRIAQGCATRGFYLQAVTSILLFFGRYKKLRVLKSVPEIADAPQFPFSGKEFLKLKINKSP